MASGKLSPRQKMINMMYLVLLALLAMNVSKEILDSFEIIKDKLNVSASVANGNADAFMQNMKKEINDEITNENKRVNEGLLDTLDQIKGETEKVIGLIGGHISKMMEIAQFDPATGEIGKKDEMEANYQYWMGQNDLANGGRGNGEASTLRDAMDGYNSYIAGLYNANVKDPADQIDTKPLTDKKGIDGENKSWEKHTFDAPVVGNMAILEALKLDVYEQQKELLDKLNERLGVARIKIDKVVPVDAPTATIVPAGLQFETKLYVSMSSSTVKPAFSKVSGGGTMKTSDDGSFATLTIPANGNVIPKGKKEGIQKYKALIRVPLATGGFDDLPVEGQFTVRQPEVVVRSAAVQNLYYKCGNDVTIDVPALGNLYSPKINASSAQVIPSKNDIRKFRIIPSAKKCVVAVSSLTNGKTVKIGNVNYTVIRPPKPTIELAVNNKKTSGAVPIPKTSKIQVRLVPDPDFKSNLPNDARYEVSAIKVLAQLTLGPPKTVKSQSFAGRDATKPLSISLGSSLKQARAGTKVYLEIDKIYRKNFKGEKIEERFSTVEKMLSLVVR